MSEEKATEEELAREAKQWDSLEITSAGWEDAPDAVPRAKESVAISIRLPVKMVAILKEFAKRAGIGYQVLMKQWLDERLKREHKRLQEAIRAKRAQASQGAVIRLVSPILYTKAAGFDVCQQAIITIGPMVEAKSAAGQG